MLEQTLRHLNRYREIIFVLLRHGLGGLLSNPSAMIHLLNDEENPASAQRLRLLGIHLRQALEELGPAYIKIGQLAGTRSDLLPSPVIEELVQLQDQVAPIHFQHIQSFIEWKYGRKLSDIFLTFHAEPLAAASIGQVHYAILKNGDPVAVKILKPGIIQGVRTDLEIFQTAVHKLNQRTKWGQLYPLQAMLEEFARSIEQELDFRCEAGHMERIREIFKKEFGVVIPRLYSELSNEHILVTEYLDGEKIDSWLSHRPLSERQKAAGRISNAFLVQILGSGYFHADPHPGNILFLPGLHIGLLDFGIVGILPAKKRIQLALLFKTLADGKTKRTVQLVSQMGVIPPGFDPKSLEADISELRKTYFEENWRHGSLGDITNQFFQIIYKHRIHIPSDYILVGKSLIALEGLTHELVPEFSLVNQAKPLIRKLLLERYLPRNLLARLFPR